MAIALAGAILIITKRQANSGATAFRRGDFFALLAMLGWAGYT